ncbi:MAG: sterol desaturase family protein [Myxococcales bacterium]|nr:sterol desaturase family protein [Myxococcales bacterium]
MAHASEAGPTRGPRRPDTCRMFENDVLERFSRIHPATPFVVWVPVALLFLVRSALRSGAGATGAPTAPVIAGLFVAGIAVWTFAEYVLHRCVFHWTNDTPWGKRVHFLLHGVHHDFPSDKDRLVMPVLTSAPLAVLFYALFTMTLGRAVGEPFFAGFVVGYLFYDGTHYHVHHFVPSTRWGKFLRRHHMTHHHADHHGGFGVSSPLWDLVFRTMPSKRSALRRASS